jgi:hypothetical protein
MAEAGEWGSWIRENFDIDLGDGHYGKFSGWSSDMDLNSQYEGVPDVEKYGLEILHPNPAGAPCVGFVTFAGDVQRRIEPERRNTWDVQDWDPLTITPSVLCSCGDHGFIREGRWVRA